jgi:hypothetical protein
LETVAELGDMADAGPREVITKEGNSISGKHIEHPHARVGPLLGVRMVKELEARLQHQQNMKVREIADDAQRLALGRDHEDRVPNGVTGRRHRLDAGQEFLLVLEENDAVAVGQ